jgi:hypothetical protein
VVTLHRGGQFKLYTCRRHMDVRLALAPEHRASAFGATSFSWSARLIPTTPRAVGSERPATPACGWEPTGSTFIFSNGLQPGRAGTASGGQGSTVAGCHPNWLRSWMNGSSFSCSSGTLVLLEPVSVHSLEFRNRQVL